MTSKDSGAPQQRRRRPDESTRWQSLIPKRPTQPVTSLLLGQRNNTFGNIAIVELMVFATGVTDTQMATLYAYARAQYPALFPAA